MLQRHLVHLHQAIKHLVKFVTFEDHDLYTGVNFKKILGAPSQFCFCLKVRVYVCTVTLGGVFDPLFATLWETLSSFHICVLVEVFSVLWCECTDLQSCVV